MLVTHSVPLLSIYTELEFLIKKLRMLRGFLPYIGMVFFPTIFQRLSTCVEKKTKQKKSLYLEILESVESHDDLLLLFNPPR